MPAVTATTSGSRVIRSTRASESAAANAFAGILAGEPHVITHGELAAAVADQQRAVNDAIAMAAQRH